MRKFLTLAALLSATALVAMPAAYAIDVGADASLDVDAVIGASLGDDGISVDGDVGADVDASAEVDGDVDADADVDGDIAFEGEDGSTTEVALTSLLNASVWTEDEVNIGMVVDIKTASDGEAVLIVNLNDGYVEGVDSLAVRISAAVATEAGLKIKTTDEDLKASLTANLVASADAAVDAN